MRGGEPAGAPGEGGGLSRGGVRTRVRGGSYIRKALALVCKLHAGSPYSDDEVEIPIRKPGAGEGG